MDYVERVVPIDWLEPYFKLAEETAKRSECVRRKYGAVVGFAGPEIRYAYGYNKRISKCCSGKICAREHHGLYNGERVEIGAEIHAETAALINAGPYQDGSHFVLVGFLHDVELFGPSVYPCHTCALNLKFAGYKHIYIREARDRIVPVSISDIIEQREEEWSRGT